MKQSVRATSGMKIDMARKKEVTEFITHCGVTRNGVAIAVGEIKWVDDEAKKYFTDSEGRVHSVVFVDPNTGERRFGR